MIKLEILLILVVLCQGNIVQVAESFTGKDFKDTNGWTILEASNAITECSGIRLFGGHKTFGRGTVALKQFQLPPHSSLQMSMQMWKIDSWDNEYFFVYVDDQLVWVKSFTANDGGTQKCGAGWNEQVIEIKVEMIHTGTTAIVVLTSSLDEGSENESWAIRDFRLFADLCPENCAACSKGEAGNVCQQWSILASSWSALDKLEVEGWGFYAEKPMATVCGGIAILGGYQSSGDQAIISKKFKLPGHSKLKIKFLLAKIDPWDDNDVAYLKLDEQIVWKKGSQGKYNYYNRICGSKGQVKDLFIRAEVEADHTGSEVEIAFTTTLRKSASQQSFGVRDFVLFISKCADNCDVCTGPTDADCKVCSKHFSLNNGKCQPLSTFTLLEQSFLENNFKEIDGWILKNNKGGVTVGKCGETSLIGGFDVFGVGASAEKTFKIPKHKTLRVQMTIFKIDTWDNEWMYVKLDGVDIYKQQWNPQTGSANLCGRGNYKDGKFPVDEIIDHEADEAHILLTSNLNSDPNDESWGFRDFRLFYEAKEPCAIFYSECDFKGESFAFCDKSSSDINWPFIIKSIRIPPQGRLTAYQNKDYSAKQTVYTESQPCISYEFQLQLLQMSGETEWKEISDEIITQ